MDEGSAKAVRVAFERLYEADLAYRTEALVNWCPGCRTSVSDLEVVATPETGTLWTVRYHLIDAATGQPDPDADDHRSRPRDRRRSSATPRSRSIRTTRATPASSGASCAIPFVERDVPIIADDVVDRGLRDGRGQDHAGPRPRRPRDRAPPRPAGAHDPGRRRDGHRHRHALRRHGPLRRARRPSSRTSRRAATSSSATPHEMVIGRCQRSDDVIEPRLKTQWFVRTGPLAARALEATRSGRTRILPERFEKTWEHWLTNIRDWNVSRQLWWGHRIPAWYCPDGHVTVSSEPRRAGRLRGLRPAGRRAPAGPRHLRHLVQLGPVAVLDARLARRHARPTRRYYPTSVMETGYDIIFFWVARMMMLGLELTGAEPFHTVYLSGLIRDPEGQKMSKTKGNVVDPLGVIDESGADALRFAVIHGATPGNDQRFGAARLEHARNFANKLWNATRFVLGRSAGEHPGRRRAAAAGRGPPRAGRALAPVARGRHDRGGRRGDGRLRVRRGHPPAVRGDLERVLRLGPRAGQGPAGRRPARPGRRARRPGGRSSRCSTRTCGCSTR